MRGARVAPPILPTDIGVRPISHNRRSWSKPRWSGEHPTAADVEFAPGSGDGSSLDAGMGAGPARARISPSPPISESRRQPSDIRAAGGLQSVEIVLKGGRWGRAAHCHGGRAMGIASHQSCADQASRAEQLLLRRSHAAIERSLYVRERARYTRSLAQKVLELTGSPADASHRVIERLHQLEDIEEATQQFSHCTKT